LKYLFDLKILIKDLGRFFLCVVAAAATCCRRLWRHRIGTLRMRRTICNLQLIERVRRRSLLSALTLLNPLLGYPRSPNPNPNPDPLQLAASTRHPPAPLLFPQQVRKVPGDKWRTT